MTLFIGGRLDGEDRHVQQELNTYYVHIRSGFVPYPEMAALPAPLKQERYYRHKIFGVEFFALSDYSPNDVMQILLAGYPRKR